MTGAALGTLIAGAAARLGEAGCPTPRLDAALLAERALGLGRLDQLARAAAPAPPEAAARLDGLIARRLCGEPVSRILGIREFWSRPFALSADTLDPRPDSETLIAAALEVAAAAGAPGTVLDLGTGSGCLLVALLCEWPETRGVGVDICAGAARQARANAAANRVGDRARFLAMDWTRPALAARFDLIICNPPYIPTDTIRHLAPEVRDFDPVRALDGGADGLAAYRHVVALLPALLAPGGRALLELGADQANSVASLLGGVGLRETGRFSDLSTRFRALMVTI